MPSFLGVDLRGHLALMLLAPLRDVGPAHGYAVIASLRERSLGAFDLPEGTVYPALHRLERHGLIDSEWDPRAPRRRRVYQLTTAGAEALAAQRPDWRGGARGVRGGFLGAGGQGSWGRRMCRGTNRVFARSTSPVPQGREPVTE